MTHRKLKLNQVFYSFFVHNLFFRHALKQLMPETRCLMLTVYEESKKIFNSLLAGASGYLLKRTSTKELLEAIR